MTAVLLIWIIMLTVGSISVHQQSAVSAACRLAAYCGLLVVYATHNVNDCLMLTCDKTLPKAKVSNLTCVMLKITLKPSTF